MLDYQQEALRTAPSESWDMGGRVLTNTQLIHAAMGLSTETGEFTDILKKHIFYGKSLDSNHLREELGDLLWYIALACDALGFSIDEVMEKNIEKLRIRYPEKFTEENALNRNLEKETEVLGK